LAVDVIVRAGERDADCVRADDTEGNSDRDDVIVRVNDRVGVLVASGVRV